MPVSMFRSSPGLCDARGAARVQDLGDIYATQPARPQTAISASFAARVGLSATLAQAPGTRSACGLVRRACPVAGYQTEVLTARHVHVRLHRQTRSLQMILQARRSISRPRHGSCRRSRHPHAAGYRRHAEAACASRRQGADRLRVDKLAEAGVGTAVVNVHYFADQIERHLEARHAPRIVISDERAQLQIPAAACAPRCRRCGSGPFFLLNSGHPLDRRIPMRCSAWQTSAPRSTRAIPMARTSRPFTSSSSRWISSRLRWARRRPVPVMADVANYTNITPVMQISEVV